MASEEAEYLRKIAGHDGKYLRYMVAALWKAAQMSHRARDQWHYDLAAELKDG